MITLILAMFIKYCCASAGWWHSMLISEHLFVFESKFQILKNVVLVHLSSNYFEAGCGWTDGFCLAVVVPLCGKLDNSRLLDVICLCLWVKFFFNFFPLLYYICMYVCFSWRNFNQNCTCVCIKKFNTATNNAVVSC